MKTPIISRSDLHLIMLLPASVRLRTKLAAATVVPTQKLPSQADGVGCVSVISPLGTALLGAAVGQELDVDIPGAGRALLRVEDVISQPEREVRRPRLAASDAFSFSLGF